MNHDQLYYGTAVHSNDAHAVDVAVSGAITAWACLRA